jgi:hypothetical protein
MLTNRIRTWTRYSALLLGALAALAATSLATVVTQEKCAGTIHDARYKEGGNEIFVSLDEPINSGDLSPGGQDWTLADLSLRPVKDIPVLRAEPDNRAGASTFTALKLTVAETLIKGHVYRLAALNLTFLGCIPEEKGTSEVTFLKPSTKPPSTTVFFPRSKSKGRDDSNVYLQGAIEGARGGKTQFSADIKIDIPYNLRKKRYTEIGPYFNLKTSTADGADANSLSTGAKLSTVIKGWESGFVRNVTWEPTVGIEGDRHFDNVNGVVGNTIYLVTAGNKKTFKKRFYFQPFIGYEIGRNFKSPVKGAEGRGISRPNVGGSLYFTFPLENDKALSIQADYIRRFLLRREFSFTEDDDKKLVPLNVGKGPRDYLKANVQYDFAKFTALTFSYEYGRLPPNFELVNHKYSFGLLLKFKTTFVQK